MENEKYVTYLFGAGASAGKYDEEGKISENGKSILPVVGDIDRRLEEFMEDISRELRIGKEEDGDRIDMPKAEKLKKEHKIETDLKWLIKNAKDHTSIDTFAKKLFILGENTNLEKLKKLLSFFFIYEQVEKLDKRYDAFLASVINKDKKLDNRLRVLSWNYDYQFEKAFGVYLNNRDLNEIQADLGVFPSPNMEEYDLESGKEAKLIKLNGTTSFNHQFDGMKNLIQDLKLEKNKIDFRNLFENAYNSISYPLIKFAWESDINKLEVVIKSIAEKTEVFVVIGYSFPFFNREIDRLFFKHFVGNTVYLVDPRAKQIEDSLNAVFHIEKRPKVKIIENVDQFFLPPEL